MTTTTTTTLTSAARRLLSISAAATIAVVCLVAFSAPAQAAPADKVWVCKYVGKPGVDETLKEGMNPIGVNSNSVDPGANGQIDIGDQFADAQGRSVVVQIGGDKPGVDICPSPEDLPPPPKPGDGAPHTGGEGGDVPVGLVGGGALLVGAALVAAAAERRRRAAAHR